MSNAATKLIELHSRIRTCSKCELHKIRTHAVVGEGVIHAKIMFIGEAPGREEDQQGRPFVGAAGRILRRLIGESGLSPEEVFISNVVRCRPPGNRRPLALEIRSCLPYLLEEIKIISPKLIVALGNTASTALGGPTNWGEIALSQTVNLPVMKAYHPAATIYNPELSQILAAQIKKSCDFYKGDG